MDFVDMDLLLAAQFNYDSPSCLVNLSANRFGRIYTGFVPESGTQVTNLVVGVEKLTFVRSGRGERPRTYWYFRTFRAIPPPHEGTDYAVFEREARAVLTSKHRIKGADLRRLILEQLEKADQPSADNSDGD